MLLEALLIGFFVIILQLCRWRPRSIYQTRLSYRHLSAVRDASELDGAPRRFDEVAADYVVIGAGPGGLASARALLERAPSDTPPSVLVIESGRREEVGGSRLEQVLHGRRRDRLLSFSPEMVHLPLGTKHRLPCPVLVTDVDEGWAVHRPLRHEEDEPLEGQCQSQVEAKKTLLAYASYPRGRGVGGCTLLDWGLHIPSIFSSDAASDAGARWRLPVRLPSNRNPLSWVFAESTEEVVKKKYMPTPEKPFQRGCVFPAFLRLDEDGRRLPLASCAFHDLSSDQLSRLGILSDHTVTDMEVSQDTMSGGSGYRVVAVLCKPRIATQTSFPETRIIVRKGVVLSAGVVHTPRLLYRVLSHARLLPATLHEGGLAWLRDTVALPFVFKANRGLSDDACNARDLKGFARWWLTCDGPFLNPIADTLVSIPIPEIHPQAELLILLLPFGGRDPQRYYRLGWDRSLGAFTEAATLLVVVKGLPGVQHALDLAPPLSVRNGGISAIERPQIAPLFCDSGHSRHLLGAETIGLLERALLRGMQACRTIITTPPLAHLATQAEAIDFTLLHDDARKALQLARLMHTPIRKLSRHMRQQMEQLALWAKGVVATEAYMRAYIQQHAYWLGYGSGSSEAFLEPASCKVKGLSNAVVGDCSAVTSLVWKNGGCDNVAAGSVSSAIDAGYTAASSLLP